VNDFDRVEVLLVEDNENDAEMTMHALKKGNFPHKVFWVSDGVEALQFIRCSGAYAARNPQELPKLVLLDLKMPRLNGFDVLRALKSEEGTRTIPIVAMTSSNQGRDVTESYRLGVNGFVTKPVQFGDFEAVVNKIGMYWLLANQVPDN
jgi:two-component system response regulator